MKLIEAKVSNYRSVEDSLSFSVSDVTCLVGKNEAGKTAILNALFQLRPYGQTERPYDKTIDYPRRFLADYATRHGGKEAEVCWTKWALSADDKAALNTAFGVDVSASDHVQMTKSYGQTAAHWTVPINEQTIIAKYADLERLDDVEREPIKSAMRTNDVIKILSELPTRTDKQDALLAKLNAFPNGSALGLARDVLDQRAPRFKLFSHFDRMSGQLSIEQVLLDRNEGKLERGDSIFLQFLEYAGTELTSLRDAARYEDLKSTAEAASNRLTDQIFAYWSQNTALEVEVDVSAGRPGDPHPFNGGTVVRARVRNTLHRASVPFSERSAGFIWFFSFLVEFTQIKKEMGNVFILMDEPGLTLHGKAQQDLLKYIYEQLKPHHQVVFSTHSPFMIPADDLISVRTVEDVIDRKGSRPIVHGTKVRSDVLSTDKDTLFPLQGALGYDIAQSLFVGEHTLLVEGPSDILYLKAASNAMKRKGLAQLDPRWVICPTGGIDKIQPFASLFGGNKLNLAVLSDYQESDRKKIEALKASNILKAAQFFTTNDFLDQKASDVEDLFGRVGFLRIVNGTYGLNPSIEISGLDNVAPQSDRIVKLVEAWFNLHPEYELFDHFTPASWLLENPSVADELFADSEVAERFAKVFTALNGILP